MQSSVLTVADTAYSIAVVRAEENDRPRAERLFEDPYAGLFAAAGQHAAEGAQRFLDLPFFRDGVRLRTRFIDDFVKNGLAAGSQVVLLGAGFDARGMRMKEIAEKRASVFEVDSSDQMERKKALLANARVTLPPYIVHVPFDFEASDLESALPSALSRRGFRVGSGAIFVWEGVIGFIGRAVIERSLRFMAHAGGPGSRLVFTFGEGSFDPDEPATVVKSAGFHRFEEIALDKVWRRYLPGEPHPNLQVSKIGTAFMAGAHYASP